MFLIEAKSQIKQRQQINNIVLRAEIFVLSKRWTQD
jgi:hypothetical protein